jgi:hypothetical protein
MGSSHAELCKTLAPEFQIIALLGSETFGSVYKPSERGSWTIIAVKSVIVPSSAFFPSLARTLRVVRMGQVVFRTG